MQLELRELHEPIACYPRNRYTPGLPERQWEVLDEHGHTLAVVMDKAFADWLRMNGAEIFHETFPVL